MSEQDQPIEKAPPQHGRAVMLFGTSDDMPAPAIWRIAYRAAGRWRHQATGQPVGGKQTHWRDLPPPPTE